MARRQKEPTRSSGAEFNAFMNSQDHAAWKKDYDARMRSTRHTVGQYDPTKGERIYSNRSKLRQKKVKQ